MWFNMGNVRLYGATSGYTELAPPAVAPDGVLSLPSGTGTIAKEKQSATATVSTQQTTTSTSFTDLATAGPAVTVTTGTKALVIVSANMFNNNSGFYSSASFAISGSTTAAADGTRSLKLLGNGVRQQSSFVKLVTNLTPGSNTFTMKYAVEGGTGTISDRDITVIDMGS